MSAEHDDEKQKRLNNDTVASIRNEVVSGVGYGQPPRQTRFKTGQSGNPRGRPRGSPVGLSLSDQPVLAAALRAGRKKIRVREGERVKEVSAHEALLDAIITYGLKGNARYAGLGVDLLRTAEQAHAWEVAEKIEFWTAYKETFSEQIAHARRNGLPEPVVYPHPEDILISGKDGPKFLGPWDEAQNKQVLHSVKTCEVLLMQDELDRRCDTHLDGSPVKEPGTALYMFNALNESLPPRFKLSDSAIFRLQMRLEGMTKRELLKQLYADWRKLGKPKSRGFISGNMTTVVPMFAAMQEFALKVASGAIDIADASLQEIADTIQNNAAERVPHFRALVSSMLRSGSHV
ncbi:DUF5681 domain-containing protein [Mesorhizobium sp. LjNodule214]|uniref:DUF5681 domain-containing protein n=1 Tax=Mesorhizobium sp. LjNodule214 TaxID=3342252 RepID=UPI003ED17078